MMQKEFETLANFDVSYEEYLEIEREYMSAPESEDKQAFVQNWLKNDGIKRINASRLRSIKDFKKANRDLEERLGQTLTELKNQTIVKEIIEKRLQYLESRTSDLTIAKERMAAKLMKIHDISEG